MAIYRDGVGPYIIRTISPEEAEASFGVYAIADENGIVVRVTLSLFVAMLLQSEFNKEYVRRTGEYHHGAGSHLSASPSPLDSGQPSEACAEKVGGV